MLKRLLGKLLILLGCFLVCGRVLLYREFGGLNSGYLIVHWSLLGILGIVLFPIGIHLLSDDKNDKNKKDNDKNE